MSNVARPERMQGRRKREGFCTKGQLLPVRSFVDGFRTCCTVLLAGGLGFAGMTQASGSQQCKPSLTIRDARLSEMLPPTLERKWTAIVLADASRCATTAGYFEVGFSRLKETAPELEFREQFIWSVPSVLIGVDFWADEAVESYWVDSIQACPCAK
jgi:hypothetical protein